MSSTSTILSLVVLVVPAGAAFGLTGSVGLQLAGGGSTINMAAPGVLGSTLVVTQLNTDTDLNGIQYYLQAWKDTGNGVLDAADTNVNSQFQFLSVFSTGKSAGPYGTPSLTRMIDFDNGGLFREPVDPELLNRADVALLGYTAGTTFAASSFVVLFRYPGVVDEGYVNGTNVNSGGISRHAMIQHEIGSVGSLGAGKYFLSAGDNGGGYLLCTPGQDCVNAHPGAYITLNVAVPEPATALLLLAVLPMVVRRRRG